jgi:hypothetical protein
MSEIPLHTIRRQNHQSELEIHISITAKCLHLGVAKITIGRENIGTILTKKQVFWTPNMMWRLNITNQVSPVRLLTPLHIPHLQQHSSNSRRNLRNFQDLSRKTVHEQYLSILQVSVFLSWMSFFYNKHLFQANSNHDIRLILSEIKSTMLSHSYPSYSMNNSNSPTYTFSLSPYLS